MDDAIDMIEDCEHRSDWLSDWEHRLVIFDRVQMIVDTDDVRRLELEKDFIQVLRPHPNVQQTGLGPILGPIMGISGLSKAYSIRSDGEEMALLEAHIAGQKAFKTLTAHHAKAT